MSLFTIVAYRECSVSIGYMYGEQMFTLSGVYIQPNICRERLLFFMHGLAQSDMVVCDFNSCHSNWCRTTNTLG